MNSRFLLKLERTDNCPPTAHQREAMEDAKWDELINGLRDGDQQSCTDFWNNYGNQLQAVAQKQLSVRS